jgi:hypothetical protein
MAKNQMVQQALERFDFRRRDEKVSKIAELRGLIDAMRTKGVPRERAREFIFEIVYATEDEGIGWSEIGVKKDGLLDLENEAVALHLKGLVRRLRTEDGLSCQEVSVWCAIIREEVAADNIRITWDRLGTNGLELDQLAKRATRD